MTNPLSEQTREYWLQTVLGWAEDRLPPPQFDECKQVLQSAHEAQAENEHMRKQLRDYRDLNYPRFISFHAERAKIFAKQRDDALTEAMRLRAALTALEQRPMQPVPSKREMLTWVFNALVGVIDSFNDLQAEPGERGRGNDFLCIILADDGSGQLGTHYQVPGQINPQEGPFQIVDDWVNYFDQWIDEREWQDAKP